MKMNRLVSIMTVSLVAAVLFFSGCSSAKPMDEARTQELAPIAEKLVSDLVNKEDAAVYATFDDAMKKAMPVDKVKEIWPQITAQGGAFKSIEGSEGYLIKKYENIIVTVLLEKKTMTTRVVFTGDNKVTGLWLNFAK